MVKTTMGLVYLMTSDAVSSMGEYLYIPELSSLRICPYAPGHASILGRFEEKTPYKLPDGRMSVEVSLCPRGTLRRVTE